MLFNPAWLWRLTWRFLQIGLSFGMKNIRKELFSVFRQAFYSALKPSMGQSAPPKSDAETLENSPCSLIFRIGYGRMLNAGEPARRTSTINRLRGQSGRVDGVDIPNLREWAEWLTARHPSLPGGRSPASATELNEMNEKARTLADFARVSGSERVLTRSAWLNIF